MEIKFRMKTKKITAIWWDFALHGLNATANSQFPPKEVDSGPWSEFSAPEVRIRTAVRQLSSHAVEYKEASHAINRKEKIGLKLGLGKRGKTKVFLNFYGIFSLIVFKII